MHAYNLHVGEYAKDPLQYRSDIEIILLTSKRPSNGSLDLAHIVLKFSDKTCRCRTMLFLTVPV